MTADLTILLRGEPGVIFHNDNFAHLWASMTWA
jgi:hypothetical protein